MLLGMHFATVLVMPEDKAEIFRQLFFFYAFFSLPFITHSLPFTSRVNRSVSWLKNFLSLFAPGYSASFCTMGALVLKGNKSRLTGLCMSGQTHTHELMKWLCTAKRGIRSAPEAQGAGHSCLVDLDTPCVNSNLCISRMCLAPQMSVR